MKILDYLFYFMLCVVASIGLFTYNIYEDIYFNLPSFDITQKHEIYEKEQWEVQAKKLLAVDITQVDSARYLIGYLDANEQYKTSLYGLLFYPNKYSTTLQKGVWQNIATNTKVHSHETLLFDTDMLKKQTRQYTNTINTALLQRDGTHLYLFLNANLTPRSFITRNYIFNAKLADIAAYIEAHDQQTNTQQIKIIDKHEKQVAHTINTYTDSIDSLFHLYKQPVLSIFANLNAFLTYKPTIISSTHNIMQGFILPFYTHFKNNMAFFGIFDKQLQLQEIIKPHDNPLYTAPIITPLHTHYNLNNKASETTTHHCLALYYKQIIPNDNTPNLAYQLCKISNGVLQFETLQESQNLYVGNAISIATFGSYVVLIYTNRDNTTLHLAVWNGTDFTPLKELDKSLKGNIISPKIFTHGAYAYIVYAKDIQKKLNIITLNEIYIDNLIATHNNTI